MQLAYAIGVAEPVSVMVNTFRHRHMPEEKMTELIRAHFPLTPKGIIDHLNLRRPIYRKTAAFGHFGRTEDELHLGSDGQGRRAAQGSRRASGSRRPLGSYI